MNPEALDELLEKLWVAEEKRTAGTVSPIVLDETQRAALAAEGLAGPSGGEVALTDRGRKRASGIIRSHRIAERLLLDVLNMEDEKREDEACTFEHNLTPGIVDSICTLLGHPSLCPHGNPIPEGECCRQTRDSVEAVVTSLPLLRLGEHAVVAYLNSRNFRRIKKLHSFGIVPGAAVELVQCSPAFVLKVEETQVALEREVAENIYVRRLADPQ